MIALVGTLVAIVFFVAGYKSGQFGWWWSGLGVAVIYWAIYTLIEV